jgi:outer membrane protein assembly factor BamB
MKARALHLHRAITLPSLIWFATLALPEAYGENWPQWRGPFQNGATTESHLPADWDESRNVEWHIELHGPGAATPIVWEDHIFMLDVNEADESISAVCLELATGNEEWRHTLVQDRKYPLNNLGSPSPVTDGQRVVFLTGNGQFHAFTLDGKPIWERNLEEKYGRFVLQFGFSSSPLLHKGTLYFQLLQNVRPNRYGRSEALPGKTLPEKIDSYLLAIEAASGDIRWEQMRPTDALDESQEAYSTPQLRTIEGREELLVAGGDVLTGHAPKTGEELWRWHTYNPRKSTNLRIVPSPLVYQDLVYVPGPKHSDFYALRPSGTGDLGDEIIVWKNGEYSPDASTPLLYKDRLYVLDDDKRNLVCQDPRTGEIFWSGKFDFRAVIRASLTGADDKIYCMSERAEVAVIQAGGEEFKLLHQAQLDARPTRATIVAAQGRLLIRTANQLLCLRETGINPHRQD